MQLTISGDGQELLLHIPLNEIQRGVLALLTRQQRLFLEMWGAGKTQKEIAAKMRISVRGVKWHAEQIRRKMNPESA